MIRFTLLVLVLNCVIVVTTYGVLKEREKTVKQAYADGLRDGRLQAPKIDINNQCLQWLFESDLIAARRKVCGKK